VDPLRVNAYDVLAHGTLVLSKQAFSRVVENLGGK
jgi:ribosomal protein L4